MVGRIWISVSLVCIRSLWILSEQPTLLLHLPLRVYVLHMRRKIQSLSRLFCHLLVECSIQLLLNFSPTSHLIIHMLIIESVHSIWHQGIFSRLSLTGLVSIVRSDRSLLQALLELVVSIENLRLV